MTCGVEKKKKEKKKEKKKQNKKKWPRPRPRPRVLLTSNFVIASVHVSAFYVYQPISTIH